jgi:hypothetical protein
MLIAMLRIKGKENEFTAKIFKDEKAFEYWLMEYFSGVRDIDQAFKEVAVIKGKISKSFGSTIMPGTKLDWDKLTRKQRVKKIKQSDKIKKEITEAVKY